MPKDRTPIQRGDIDANSLYHKIYIEKISWDQRLFKFMFLFSWLFIWEKVKHTPDAHKYKQKNGKKKERNEKHAKKHSEIKWTIFVILVSVDTCCHVKL